jgi:hypothetical protein
MYFPDGGARRFGQGAPSFCVRLKNRNAVRAITSIGQVKFADAYLAGDIDIDGDMLRPFELRHTMGDLHPLMTAWRFLQPLLLRQVRANKAAIASHYEIDADFFLRFLLLARSRHSWVWSRITGSGESGLSLGSDGRGLLHQDFTTSAPDVLIVCRTSELRRLLDPCNPRT